MSIDLAKIVALPGGAALAALEKAEHDYIAHHIQRSVYERFLSDDERIEFFSTEGEGLNKSLRWFIKEGVECEGCDGSGTLSSNRGTKTDCPDCDGAGELFGRDAEEREIVTDYDGDELLEGENRCPPRRRKERPWG